MRAVPATLRARITVLAAVAVLVVLSLASAGLVLAQRAALVDAVDENLDLQADVVADQLRTGRTVRDGDLPREDVVVEVLGPDGARLASSPGLAGPLPLVDVEDRAGPVTVELPGEPGEARLLARTVDGSRVLVAGELDDVADSTAALAGPLVVAVPLTAAVLAGVVWWAVGRALGPVEDIRARVETISAARLDLRVPEPGTPREISRLARTMNAMLTRLHRSAQQQRRFVADAAHELRSPLARMRAELEVDAAHPGSADPAATASSVLAETIGLQRLVDDLLLLAREDAAAAPRRVPVDLDDVVETVVRARRDPRVVARDVAPVQVSGDPDALERVLANLLDNAVRYARDRVDVTLSAASGGTAELTVTDDGPGIPVEDAERIFERFTRLDDARSAREGGAGLGLAIARGIAVGHGGSLELDGSAPGGARFVLRLPRAPAGGATV